MAAAEDVLRYEILTENALPPTRETPKSAGIDLRSAYNNVVPAWGNALIKTDLAIQLHAGCYGRIAPRSSLALLHTITVGGGVVDEDYRGNVCVILFNHSETPFQIYRWDRAAQLICEKMFYPELEEVKVLDNSERGTVGVCFNGS
jgi:dUTP pyrophosphatase